MKTPTPHNSAEKGMISSTVLMPGDPLRAKFIAEEFLEGAVLVNGIRNMLAYTGTYKGERLTVMGSGMGMPSIGIYSYELFNFYDVENIIRIGSAISFDEKVGLWDIVLGTSACSQSSFAKIQNGFDGEVLTPSTKLVKALEDGSEKLGIKVFKGAIFSSDVFYYEEAAGYETSKFRQKYNCVCGEMESFALYSNAQVLGKNAATILTISDSAFLTEEVAPEERQIGFRKMMQIALESIKEI